MQKVCFTSDSHYHHGNIIKYCFRPFLADIDKKELARIGAWHDGEWKGEKSSRWRMSDEAVQMMNDTLINQTNATVGENDILWHLGDFGMAPKQHWRLKDYYKQCRECRDRIKCKDVRLVWGNHDDPIITDLFSETHLFVPTLYIPGQKYGFALLHYAMAVWNKSHRGNLHLYGHSHSEAEPWLDRVMVGRRSMDVGVDNAHKLLGAFRPFTLDEVVGRLAPQPGFAFDHHMSLEANTPNEEELS